MPRLGRPPKEKTRVVGLLAPGCLLTLEGCMRQAGLGRDSLRLARKSGLVKPIPAGRRIYYRTDELIEWIVSQADAPIGREHAIGDDIETQESDL